MDTHPELVGVAARNNAEWVATMCRAHGISSHFGPRTWSSPTRSPMYCPDAISLVPGIDPSEVLSPIDGRSGASIKDSFADVDLGSDGFGILFEAQWIYRTDRTGRASAVREWHAVDDLRSMQKWALAAGDTEGRFRAELLEEPSACLIAVYEGGDVIAGAIANRSEAVVGVSNVFAHDAYVDEVWLTLLPALRELYPALPVVGYEQDDDLARALTHGFEPIGPLRIWMRE